MRLSGGVVGLLVAALLVGGAFGFAGGVFTMARRERRLGFDGPIARQVVLRRLENQLELRPDQVRAVREIIDRHHEALIRDRLGAQQRLGSARDSIQVEIERLLDDSQKVKYRSLVEKLHGRRGRGNHRHEGE
jgi:hypothetical protein